MGDGFQIKGFIKIKQYKKDGTVIRDEKVYNKVTDIGRQWFLHKGSAPILQNNLANFGQSDFFNRMDFKVYNYNKNVYGYREINNDFPRNYLFNLPQDLYDAHKAVGGAKNFIGDKNTLPTIVGWAAMNANPQTIASSAAQQGLAVDSTNVGVTEDFKVSQTWRYPEGCAVGNINAIGMLQSDFSNNKPNIGFAKCITPRIPNAEKDVGNVQAYIPPNVVYNRGKDDEVVWTKPNEIIVHTTGNYTFKIELDTGKCNELKPSDLGYNLDFIPTNVASYINCTLYGENKVLYVAYNYNYIRIVNITATNISVTTGSTTVAYSSDTPGIYDYLNIANSIISMFTRVVNGERHVFIIGNYYWKTDTSAKYYVTEWKLDGTRISLSPTALEIKPAFSAATGGDYSKADGQLCGIIDAGDGVGYVGIMRIDHYRDSFAVFYVRCGKYFTDISDYANSVTDRALLCNEAVNVIEDKLCSIYFGQRSEAISYNSGNYGPTRANLMFSKEGWAGNLISMKLLQDPIIKGEDDILDITYGYEIGEKND